MDSEQMFFLNTLREHIHGLKTKIPDELDINKVSMFAREHQLEPIFYYQTRCDEFREAFYSQLLLYDIRSEMLEGLRTELKGIPHVIMKGPFVAEYYPVKELRTMGDIDIVVHPEDRARANDCLEKNGFKLSHKLSGEWEYSNQGVLIELHTAVVYQYSKASSESIHFTYFNNFWDHVENGELELNFHILYLFWHLRKHIMETGVGFRQFLDIAVVTEKASADWEWIKREAEKLDLFPFIRTVMSINEKWFHTTSPYEHIEIEDDFFETATQHIFKDGVFGFENKENFNNRAINERKKTGKRFTRMKVLTEHIFWPYEKMINMPEYSWLKRKRFLLPAAWGMRAFIKIKEWGTLKKRYFASSHEVDDRYKYLSNWRIHNERE